NHSDYNQGNYSQNQGNRTTGNNQNRNQFQNQSGNKFCNYCKKPGHLINECRKREYNNNKKQATGDSKKSIHLSYSQTQVNATPVNEPPTISSNSIYRQNDKFSNRYVHRSVSLSNNNKSSKHVENSDGKCKVESIMLSQANNNCYLDTNLQDLHFRFLVDTGAGVSLIKTEKFKQLKDVYYDPKDTIMLNWLST